MRKFICRLNKIFPWLENTPPKGHRPSMKNPNPRHKKSTVELLVKVVLETPKAL